MGNRTLTNEMSRQREATDGTRIRSLDKSGQTAVFLTTVKKGLRSY